MVTIILQKSSKNELDGPKHSLVTYKFDYSTTNDKEEKAIGVVPETNRKDFVFVSDSQ